MLQPKTEKSCEEKDVCLVKAAIVCFYLLLSNTCSFATAKGYRVGVHEAAKRVQRACTGSQQCTPSVPLRTCTPVSATFLVAWDRCPALCLVLLLSGTEQQA